MLALADLPAKLLPRLVARDLRSVGTLRNDQADIPERVVVERCPGAEPRGERFGIGHALDGFGQSFTRIGSSVGVNRRYATDAQCQAIAQRMSVDAPTFACTSGSTRLHQINLLS